MHCTGLGKALLAYRNNAEINSILMRKGMAAMTSNTFTEIPALKEELKTIREQGYAIDNCEGIDNIYCVAAPIFDPSGHAKYAISVTGRLQEMQEAQSTIIPLLKQCAHDISYALGYREEPDSH